MRRARLLSLVALLAGPASAAIEVSPIRIELTRAAPNTLVVLTNSGAEEARFELRPVSWKQDETGKMQLDNTKDVFVYPPLLTLKPGERRNVRVAVEPSLFGQVERTYRLIAQELPRAPKAGEPRHVQVLARLSIPIFVEPEHPTDDLRIEGLGLADGRASLELVNAGNVAQRPLDVVVEALDAAGASVARERWEGWYVLASGRRGYAWQIPAAACKAVASLKVEVRLEKRVLAATVAAARGACGS
jgi:fimbrial chaperone protein